MFFSFPLTFIILFIPLRLSDLRIVAVSYLASIFTVSNTTTFPDLEIFPHIMATLAARSLFLLVWLLVAMTRQAAAFAPLGISSSSAAAIGKRPHQYASVLTPSLHSSTIVLQQSSKPQVSTYSKDLVDKSRTMASSTLEPVDDSLSYLLQTSSNTYMQFAKENPLVNSIAIASVKTAAADLLAQTVIGGASLGEIDLPRCLLFFLFGGLYSGAFQYVYQVQIFKQLFDVDKFTQQSWSDKLRDTEGLKSLAAQTALDLLVLTAMYLPAFYIFKASVFEGTLDPSVWFSVGSDNYLHNFSKDEFDLVRVWFPADLVCFSVALYLRLPVRHIVSFVWTAYLSFARGGH